MSKKQFKHNAKIGAVGTTGGVLGGATGAIIGCAAGTAICPVVGTIIGTLVGGLAGGITSSKISTHVYLRIEDRMERNQLSKMITNEQIDLARVAKKIQDVKEAIVEEDKDFGIDYQKALRIMNLEKDSKLAKIDMKFLFLLKLIENAEKKNEDDIDLARSIKSDIEKAYHLIKKVRAEEH